MEPAPSLVRVGFAQTPPLVCARVSYSLPVCSAVPLVLTFLPHGVLAPISVLRFGRGRMGARKKRQRSKSPLFALLFLFGQSGFSRRHIQVVKRLTLFHLADCASRSHSSSGPHCKFCETRVLSRVLARSSCSRPFLAGA